MLDRKAISFPTETVESIRLAAVTNVTIKLSHETVYINDAYDDIVNSNLEKLLFMRKEIAVNFRQSTSNPVREVLIEQFDYINNQILQILRL